MKAQVPLSLRHAVHIFPGHRLGLDKGVSLKLALCKTLRTKCEPLQVKEKSEERYAAGGKTGVTFLRGTTWLYSSFPYFADNKKHVHLVYPSGDAQGMLAIVNCPFFFLLLDFEFSFFLFSHPFWDYEPSDPVIISVVTLHTFLFLSVITLLSSILK